MTAIQDTAPHTDHAHDDHHHDHPSWLAHHFDDAEQQYDSGKLGMWLFLVTEVLFFSGMFLRMLFIATAIQKCLNSAVRF